MKKITKDTKLGDIMKINPDAGMILFEHGLACIGCGLASMETLEQGCLAHGMEEKEINEVIERLNSNKSPREKPENKIKKLPKKKATINKLKEMIA
jgi:hybrid cluster-associated redox disulfide protein